MRSPAPLRAFFTVSLAARGSALLLDRIDVLREAVSVVRRRRPFEIDAWVVLPDHMHAIWTLPPEDPSYSDRWGQIKARFSRHVRAAGARLGPLDDDPGPLWEPAGSSQKPKSGDAGIWRARFLVRPLDHHTAVQAHIRRCYMDPVRHGLVTQPEDWHFTSLHRDLRQGRCTDLAKTA